MIGDRVPDKRIIQKVNQRLGRAGVAQCKIAVSVRNGYVTLTGTIQYETQRRSLLNAARGVEGVRSVVDELTVKPKAKKWA
jgi:osmotically-inducible protein OsmY